MKQRNVLLLVMAGVVVFGCYFVRFEGTPQPADPLLVVLLPAAPAWQAQPLLLQNSNEPEAIYIVTGLSDAAGRFAALRLDVKSGARSSERILFGPDTGYLPFDSAEVTGIPALELRGVTLRRLTPYLFKFPGPGGPGFDFVESATGVAHIVAGTGKSRRTLLTLTLINSSRVPEIRSFLWSDRSRRLAAVLWRGADTWTLYLFSLLPDQR